MICFSNRAASTTDAMSDWIHPYWTGRIVFVGLFLISGSTDATDLPWMRRLVAIL